MWRSSEHDVFINPSPQGSGIYAEEEEEWLRTLSDGWLQENGVFQTQHDQYTHELTEPVTAQDPSKFKPDKNPSTEKDVTKVSLLTEKLFATDTCWEREWLIFSNEVTHSLWPSLMPRRTLSTQNRLSVFLCVLFFCYCLVFFVLLILSCLSFMFFWFFEFFERERIWSWVDMEVGRIFEDLGWGGRRCMIKIHCMEKIFKRNII